MLFRSNASLNATCALLLLLGYGMIRQERRVAHGICMAAAVFVSLVFLCSYLYYHAHAGTTRFTHPGPVRYVYLTILLTHTVQAMVVALWLVPVTLWRTFRRRFDRHKAIARWTLPIWLYVSVTGVVIYFMLYHWYAPA